MPRLPRLRTVLLSMALIALTCHSQTAECLDPHSSYLQYLTQLWTMSNGFPGGRINSIAQTSDGYLWIGTSGGVVRFDGFTFALVGSATGLATPSSQALSLVSTKDGALWFWDQDMNLRRYAQGRFEDAALLAGEEGGLVSAIARSNDGDVIVATQAPRLFRFHHVGGEALTDGSLAIPSPQTIAQTSDGRIWMATYEAGIFYWDRGNVAAPRERVPDKINCLLPVRNSGLWIGTDDGVVFWDGHKISSKIPVHALGGARVLSLAEDRNANLWIGTSDGLFRWNSEGLEAMRDPEHKSNRIITAIFEDREGNLWVGDAQGLERLRDGAFTNIPIGVSGSESAGPMYRDDWDRIWIAPSSGGLYCVVNGRAVQVTQGARGREVIYSIAGYKDDLWVGTREGGLTHLLQVGGSRPSVQATRTYTRAQGLAQNSVPSVFRSSDGTIWAGTLSGGVSKLQNGSFTTLTSADGLGSNTVSSIQEDRDGAMWFGTSDGLSRLVDGEVKTFRARDGLPSDEVTTLMMDSFGVLWVGTSQGLAYLSLGQLHPVLDARPASHEAIFGIAEDHEHSFWFTSSNHVFRVRRNALMKDAISEGDYREFGATDGLRATEGVRRDRSAITDAKGRVWLSTLSGLWLSLGTPQNAEPAPPHVESLSSDGKPINLDGPVNIDPEPQRIVLAYEAVSLAVPNRVRYRYKLQGFDHVWSDPTEAREVVYTNLGPGPYRFGLQTSEGGDKWKGSDAVLSFTIQPTVQQSWWFQLLWATGLSVSAVVLYQLRVRFMARALSAQFDARLEERTRMARELHDTFLQTVQGSKLVADDALSPGANETRMRTALEKLSGWLGQAVVEGRAALHALRVSTTEENELAEFLDRALKEQCDGSLLSVALTVIGNPKALHPIVRDEVSLIAKEAIRNTSSHSEASLLRAKLIYAADLSLSLTDNGIGMSSHMIESGKAGHFGLVGMKERSARIGGRITVSSSHDCGTEVLLRVPGHVAYKHDRRSWRARFSASFISGGVKGNNDDAGS